MFDIRVIKTISIKSIEDLIENFEFDVAIVVKEKSYKVTLSYVDPISKERNDFGDFLISNEKVKELLEQEGNFEENIKKIAKENPFIVNKLF